MTPRTLGTVADRNDNKGWVSEKKEQEAVRLGRHGLTKSIWSGDDSPDAKTMERIVSDPVLAKRYIETGKTAESLTPEITTS